MQVLELSEALRELIKACETSGKKHPFGKAEKIASFLSSGVGLTIEEFAASLREPKKDVRKSPKTTNKTMDQQLVSDYVAELTAAESSQESFQALLAKISGDKTLRKAEMDAIANAYIGIGAKWVSKAKAVSAIKLRYQERMYQGVKSNVVQRSRPW